MSAGMVAWIAGAYSPAERGGSSLAVLAQLGLHVDHAGRVEMSHSVLGRRIKRSARQVQTHVKHLAAAGWLSVTEQFDRRTGARMANVCRILAPWVLRMIEGEANAPGEPPPAADGTPPAPATPPPHPPLEPPPLGLAPALLGTWLTPAGGCVHQDPPACDECRAHG